jgi:hypothetical protein
VSLADTGSPPVASAKSIGKVHTPDLADVFMTVR